MTSIESDSESGAAGVFADAIAPITKDATISIGDGSKELDAFSVEELVG